MPQMGGLNNKRLRSLGSGGQKSKIEVPGLVSGEAVPPGLQTATLRLPSHSLPSAHRDGGTQLTGVSAPSQKGVGPGGKGSALLTAKLQASLPPTGTWGVRASVCEF